MMITSTTKTTTSAPTRDIKPGSTVYWRMISGCDDDGRPVYDDWGRGEVIGPDESDPDMIIVRRLSHSGGIVWLRPDQIA